MTPRRTPGRERGHIALLVMIGLLLAWLMVLSHVYFNASRSDDAWGYLRLPLPGRPALGEAVMFEPPDGLNAPVPYLKTVRGLPGAAVAVDAGGTVRIDGAAVGRAKPRALDGRPLAPIAAGTIPPNHYYLHADHPDSHDSRYAEIGLVPRARILGRAVPLPDIPWLGLDGPPVGPHGPAAEADRAADAELPDAGPRDAAVPEAGPETQR